MCFIYKVLRFLEKYLEQFRTIMVKYLHKFVSQHPINMKSDKHFYQSKQSDIKRFKK